MDVVGTFLSSFVIPFFVNILSTKFSDKYRDSDKSLLENEISDIYHLIIKSFNEKFKNEKNSDFLEKQVVLEELFKFRYLESYIIDKDKLHNTLNNYHEYFKLNKEQIDFFFDSLEDGFKNNPKLKNLYINANFREEVFNVSKVVVNIQNDVKKILQNMDDNSHESLKDEIIMFIKDLKVKTALNLIQKLEDKYNSNPSTFSENLVGEIFLLKGYCQKIQFNLSESYKSFINAYNYNKKNINIAREACFSYYRIKNNKYKEIMKILFEKDQFDPIYWTIEFIESNNKEKFIEQDEFIILSKNRTFVNACFLEILTNKEYDIVYYGKRFNILREDQNQIDEINCENIHYYIVLFNCVFSQYMDNCKGKILENNNNNKEFLFLYRILEVFNNTLLKSELQDDEQYKLLIFLYWLFKYFKENNEDNMKVLLNHFNELNNVDELTAVLMTKAIMKSGRFSDGVALINKNGHFKNEYLIFSKYLFLFQTDNNHAIMYSFFDEINDINDYNVHYILEFILIILRKNVSFKNNVLEKIQKKKMPDLNKNQLILFIDSFNEREPLSLNSLNYLASMFYNDNLIFYFAIILFNHQNYDECVNLLVANEFEKTYTREFDLIIQSLIHENKRSVLLLDYLTYWRLKCEENEYYLSKEIELLAIIDRWDEVFTLSNNFLINYCNSPYYDLIKYNYIMSVVNLSKIDEIKINSNTILEFKYSNENQIIYIVQHLFLYGFKKLSLELLFKNAINKNNVDCRAYFFAKHNDYHSFYREYDIAEIGSNVVYNFNGVIYQMKINNSNDKTQQKFIGKRKRDLVKMKLSSQKEYSVEIIAICDDYIALFYELLNETPDPANKLGVEVIKFNENNPEEFQNLILTMGYENRVKEVDGEKNEYSFDISINEYKNKNISLWELSYTHFNKSYFQCLNFFKEQNWFLQTEDTPNILNTKIYKNYYFDLPSSIHLYNICIEFNIKIEKFFISHSVLKLIKKELYELNNKLNVESTIYSDGTALALIQNHKDKVKESRKQLLQFERWLKENAIAKTPQEKLEIPPQILTNKDLMHEYAIEYVILSRIPDTAIVTDDFCFGFFKNQTKAKISFLQCLAITQVDSYDELCKFLNKTFFELQD